MVTNIHLRLKTGKEFGKHNPTLQDVTSTKGSIEISIPKKKKWDLMDGWEGFPLRDLGIFSDLSPILVMFSG